jgi:NAD(P)-dependent dehydrogenase (short-subunit alcohol dehydrogenase family)
MIHAIQRRSPHLVLFAIFYYFCVCVSVSRASIPPTIELLLGDNTTSCLKKNLPSSIINDAVSQHCDDDLPIAHHHHLVVGRRPILVSRSFHWKLCTSTSTHTSSRSNNSDKLVLVTGGSRGISRATCLLLASKGYKVALNYCTSADAAKSVVAEAPEQIMAFQADVSDPDQVAKLFDDIKQHFHANLTGLVNNAAVMEAMEKDITKYSHETLIRDLKTNPCGPFYCTQEFVRQASTTKHPAGKGGSIVCISSISAKSAQILAYGMSKAALEAMVNGLSKNLPLEGIRINIVQPGLIDTGLASPDIMEAMSGVIPARRPGKPVEVARAIEFLLSDASAYCSGAKLRIAGGL